jgi:hypothetical protein
VNGTYLLALRQTRSSDTRSERRHDAWKTCKSCSTQCNSDLIRRRACFWPSSELVCQSPISLSPYALELLISMEYRHILMASIAEPSMSLSVEAKIGPALKGISGAISDHLLAKRFHACAAASCGRGILSRQNSDLGIHHATIIGFGWGVRLLSSTTTTQGTGTSTGIGTAPAQISASSPPLMFTDFRNQKKATNLDLHRPFAVCQTYQQRGNSRTLPLAAAVLGKLGRLWRVRVQRTVSRLATTQLRCHRGAYPAPSTDANPALALLGLHCSARSENGSQKVSREALSPHGLGVPDPGTLQACTVNPTNQFCDSRPSKACVVGSRRRCFRALLYILLGAFALFRLYAENYNHAS